MTDERVAQNRRARRFAWCRDRLNLFDPAKSSLPDNIKAKAAELRDEINKKRSAANSIVERQRVEMNGFNPTNHSIAALMPDGQQTAIFSQLSRESILSSPVGYLETVAENVYAAYAVYSLANFGQPGAELLEASIGHKIEHHSAIDALAGFYAIPATLDRDWFLTAFALSLLVLATSADNPLSLIGLYAGGLHFTGIAFTSIATVFIPRYATTLDAMLLVAIASGVAVLARSLGSLIIRSVLCLWKNRNSRRLPMSEAPTNSNSS